MRSLHTFAVAVALSLSAFTARAETITVATYNIEHFESHFEGHRLRKLAPKATTRPSGAAGDTTPAEPADKAPTKEEAEQAALEGPGDVTKLSDVDIKDLVASISHQNDEDNWEVAEVITDERFNPDVLVIEEGCDQSNLEYFNERWLKKAYATAITFPTNTTRNQHLCMLLKPGFQILAKKDQYYLEKDTGENARGDRLFAGPAFVLLQTPGGYKFWVGVTHQKSKSGNNLEVTKWRNREAARTHEIMKELKKQGPADVMLLGDMNDEFGEDEFEKKAGADAITTLVGPKADGFVLATQPLIDAKQNSFGGYWNPKFRSLIDHVIVTPDMKCRIEDVKVFNLNVARVASDHFPVYVKVKCD